jgi:hypothetical protein
MRILTLLVTMLVAVPLPSFTLWGYWGSFYDYADGSYRAVSGIEYHYPNGRISRCWLEYADYCGETTPCIAVGVPPPPDSCYGPDWAHSEVSIEERDI